MAQQEQGSVTLVRQALQRLEEWSKPVDRSSAWWR